jgi:hypothetical protein
MNSNLWKPFPLEDSDPIELFDAVQGLQNSLKEEYWSEDSGFWLKWTAEERNARTSSTQEAQTRIKEYKIRREAAESVAADKARELEKEAGAQSIAAQPVKLELATPVRTNGRVESVALKPITLERKLPESTPRVLERFEKIIEAGKTFRSEFIAVWREIALSVSTTAGNARSIQTNSQRLISCLNRSTIQAGPARPDVPLWLSAVCGSKIMSQASSGNKSLVWAFVYLARITAEKFPEVIRLGLIGELLKASPHVLDGVPGLPVSSASYDPPSDAEMYTRVWLAMMCVLSDQHTFWSWVAYSINSLIRLRSQVLSPDAMWNLMRIFVLLDVGFHDFRKLFGSQAMLIVDLLENRILPNVDKQLANTQQSTSASVQSRFYVDACYNILQTRKYSSPSDGQVLSASKESELNPEL